jgi:hypothetical protein
MVQPYCPRCGAALRVQFQPSVSEMTGDDIASCPTCADTLSAPDFDDIQNHAAAGRVPAATLLNAARMLGRPADAAWVRKEFASVVKSSSGELLVPLPAIHDWADRSGVAVAPLDRNIPAIWV